MEIESEHPAKAQQDDERVLPSIADSKEQCDIAEVLHEDGALVWGVALVKAQQILDRLADRPSDDTETLRARIEKLAERWESEVTPRSFHPAGTHTDGRSQALADAAADLRSALDGTR